MFDLHEGFLKGVVDSVSTGMWTLNGWHNPQPEPCTFLRVNLGPFQSWMYSQKGDGNDLKVTLVGPSDQALSAPLTVLGVDEPTPDNRAYHKLVVQGTGLPAWVGAGCWFPSRKLCFRSGTFAARTIDGRRDRTNVAQSGTWAANASGGTFTVISFSATNPKPAGLTQQMVGWVRVANDPNERAAF